MPKLSELTIGDELLTQEFTLNRQDLIKYAGASGDFNPIHYSDAVATEVGLEGVLAHGMLTMGAAVQTVVAWVKDPTRIIDYQVRFTRPVWVEERGQSQVMVSIKVHKIDEESQTADLMLDVKYDEKAVLGKAIARVKLDS